MLEFSHECILAVTVRFRKDSPEIRTVLNRAPNKSCYGQVVDDKAGGIYLFEDEASLDSYLAGKIERMKASGIEGVRARKFDVNERLTQITRGRISE